MRFFTTRRQAWCTSLATLALCVLVLPTATAQEVLHYWSFNDAPASGNPWPATIAADEGDGVFTHSFGENTNNFSGTTLNAISGYAAGRDFAMVGSGTNNESFTLDVSTEGYENITFSYAIRVTSTGHTHHLVAYSVDGGDTFAVLEDHVTTRDATYRIVVFDLSDVEGAADNESLLIRVTVRGIAEGNTTGNSRIDNVRVSGAAIPAIFEVQLTGRAGWRMLSSPVAGATYEELLDGIWTQGFPGAGSEAGEPNVVLYSEPARAWQPPSGIDAVIGASEGFIAYVYEFDLPATLSVSGAENAEVLERMLSYTETGDLGERGWNLVGNPFTQAIEVGGLGLQDNADVSNFVYIWDPNAGASGDYVAINAADAPQTAIAAFQGFWVKANADGQTFDIPETAKTTGGTFYGRPVASTEPAPRIGLTLSHEASSSQAFITFREDGLMGVDANDGFLPASLGTEYVRIYSALEGIGRFMYQNLPQALSGVVSIPVGVQATSGGTFELSWTLPADFGTAWQVALIDSQTGAEVDMRATSSYSFTADASPEGAERFSVEITTSGVSSEDGAGRFAFTLHGVYPNPAAGQATVAFELASAGEASVAVYDVMGRRVAVLSEGEHAAGRHEVSLDGTSLASGIYVVRVTAGEHVASERFTLVR
jgi:hypothetical protein